MTWALKQLEDLREALLEQNLAHNNFKYNCSAAGWNLFFRDHFLFSLILNIEALIFRMKPQKGKG